MQLSCLWRDFAHVQPHTLGVIGFVWRRSKQRSVKPTEHIGSGVNEWWEGYALSKIKYEGFLKLCRGTLIINKNQAEESF